MPEKILKSKKIYIARKEANFDRTCNEAYDQAIALLGIDDDGHADQIKGWDRSSCYIRVVFEGYQHTGSMGGQEYQYVFRGEAVKG